MFLILEEEVPQLAPKVPSYADLISLTIPFFLKTGGDQFMDEYFFQMYVKFTADLRVNSDDNLLLFVEADAIFTKPVTYECFFTNQKISIRSMEKLDMWKKGADWALNFPNSPYKYLIGGNGSPVLLHKESITGARARIELVHGKSFDTMVTSVFRPEFKWSPSNLMFSEFHIIHLFAVMTDSKRYTIALFHSDCSHHVTVDRDAVHGKIHPEFFVRYQNVTSKGICYFKGKIPTQYEILYNRTCQLSTRF